MTVCDLVEIHFDLLFVELVSRADKNLKAELGLIFDCLGGTEKKVRKSQHFAKKLHKGSHHLKKKIYFAKKFHKTVTPPPVWVL